MNDRRRHEREGLRNRVYYQIKPFIPRSMQIWLRSILARRHRRAATGRWPILEEAHRPPSGWAGWPEGKRFAFVLMHDVETAVGHEKCRPLMALEEGLGFRSSFNFVPRRYRVSVALRQLLASCGFEIGVHGLYHDGKLYQSSELFLERAQAINQYLEQWDACGFCSPASHHRLQWNHALKILYDSSTFDSDPFEPESDGVESIFPFWVPDGVTGRGYVELPYTLPQDFTIFVLLKEKSTEIWKRKLDWIAEKGGMALLITHPDYMNFAGGRNRFDEYPAEYYAEFLNYAKAVYGGDYWQPLPGEVATFYRGQYGHGQTTDFHSKQL